VPDVTMMYIAEQFHVVIVDFRILNLEMVLMKPELLIEVNNSFVAI
jgi:hypothetical protein